MKRIVMTTETTEAVTMGNLQFRTGIPVEVDDALADNLLRRRFPRFAAAPENGANAQPDSGKPVKKNK